MRELRLEWEEREGRDEAMVASVLSDDSLIVWGSPEEKYSAWLNWNRRPPQVNLRSLDTIEGEAQVAAEDALQAALLPYAQLWAKLAGVELPTLEVELPTEEVGE